MVLHNPNNWHWVNKDTSGWARDYLSKELIGLEASKDGVSATIDKILSMDGDVDVSQRKGKVITLFDVKLQLEYSGRTKAKEVKGEETEEGEEVSGTITVPEVAHDTEEDEYVFDIDIYSDASQKQPVKTLIRSDLTPLLRKKLATLGPALIAAHGAGLQHAKDTSNGTNSTTSTVKSSSSVSKDTSSGSSISATSASSSAPKVNTTTVSLTDEFRTTAEELYSTFTDAARLAAFTRHPPSPFPTSGTAEPNSAFGLFGGNVSGVYTLLQPASQTNSPKAIIKQNWRLQQWPAGHHAELTLEFDQNDVDRVTMMRTEFRGVPVGQEEVVRRNWEGYYVRQIKGVFGFGTIL